MPTITAPSVREARSTFDDAIIGASTMVITTLIAADVMINMVMITMVIITMVMIYTVESIRSYVLRNASTISICLILAGKVSMQYSSKAFCNFGMLPHLASTLLRADSYPSRGPTRAATLVVRPRMKRSSVIIGAVFGWCVHLVYD